MKKEEQREIDFMDYWQIIARRKNILFVFAGALIILVGIYLSGHQNPFSVYLDLLN